MDRFQSLLVEIHEEPSSVLDRAARIAERDGAELTLVAVAERLPALAKRVLPEIERMSEAYDREWLARLEEHATALRERGFRVKTKLIRGRPAVELAAEVEQERHDLVLRGRRLSDAGEVLVSDDNMSLLRSCPCPVYLVRPMERPLRRVLVAVDPDPEADAVDEMDADLLGLGHVCASLEGGELVVLHAWEAVGQHVLRAKTGVDVSVFVDRIRELAVQAVDRLLEHVDFDIPRSAVHVEQGDPKRVIPDYVRDLDADLLVMGTLSRSRIVGLLMGSTAEFVIPRVDCSILAPKPASIVERLLGS